MRLALACAPLRIPNLVVQVTKRNVVNALAAALSIVPVIFCIAFVVRCTLALARSVVEHEAIIALANADAGVDGSVPDLIKVTFVRQGLAGAVPMVKVFVTRSALFVGAL